MSGGTTGKLGVNTTDIVYYLNQRVGKFSPKKNLNRQYLYYFLHTKSEESLKIAGGAAQPNLSTEQIKNFQIPIPPLSEQQAIVEKLDTAFDLIDRAKANIEQNIQNAKELFQSKLNQVFSQKGEGWEEKKLRDICEFDKTKNTRDLPYVGLENIESNSGKFIGSFENFKVKSDTFYFNSNHILYGRLRPYLNKVLIPNFEGHCSTEIFPLKVNAEKVHRNFLFHWLMSSNIVDAINTTCTGARMPRANMNEVLNFEFSFPKSLKTQQKIVAQLDVLSAQSSLLQEKYQQKLANLEELRKSILEKAFNGELV